MVGARVRRQQVAYAQRARPVGPPRVRLALGRAVDARLRVAAGRAGCAGASPAMRDAWPRSIRGTAIARSGSSSSAQGHVMSADRTYRLWRQAGLQVPKTSAAPTRGRPVGRGRCRRPAINHVWAYDFVFDTCADGQHAEVPDGHRRVHARVPGDRCGRRHPVGARHRGARAARERPRRAALSALGQRPGVRRDGDPAVAAGGAASRRRFIDPGKPWQNGADESFNGKFRDEYLTLQWFRNRVDAQGRASSSGAGTTTRCGRTRVSAI